MEIEVNGITTRCELSGPEGAPVVICSHCLAGNMAVWDWQMDELRQKYRVLRYDIRGHGGSSAPEGAYSMEMLADDVLAMMDALEIGRVHFMGISLGGMIGQVLALSNPERVESLVLCDTTCTVPKELRPIWEERIQVARGEGMAALAGQTLERWFSPGFRGDNPGIVQKIEEMILATPVSGYAGCSRAISDFNVKAQLHRISTPTLIMVGENDPGTPVEAAREIHESIAGSSMVELPGAYHLSNIEAAEQFNENLAAFLSRPRK